MKTFKEVTLEEIYAWHTDCDGEECEIREAIKNQSSEEELFAIAMQVDPELFDKSRDVYQSVE